MNKDIHKIIRKEKDGFSYRILNLRNSAETTVIFSKLRGKDLNDMLKMEINPKRFLIETGKPSEAILIREGTKQH